MFVLGISHFKEKTNVYTNHVYIYIYICVCVYALLTIINNG